jgi:lipopolysaccharide biosynthesis glycosyltransferase
MNRANIVFACDDNYAMPFAVALESLLSNKINSTFYNILCLVPSDFSSKNIEKINQVYTKYENFGLSFYNMKDNYKDASSQVDYISHVTCYRLSLPSILHQESRCLYIDVDTIITEDLYEIYQMDMQDNYLAAVREPDIRVEGLDKYFNAGVLLMNLEQLRKDNKEEEFKSLIPKNFKLLDQDIVNVACEKRIVQIDYRYNHMTSYLNYKDLNILLKRAIQQGVYGQSTFEHPAIIHYNAPYKPWLIKGVLDGGVWDTYYQMTAYGDITLTRTNNNVLKFYRLFVWFKKIPLLSALFHFARGIVFKHK